MTLNEPLQRTPFPTLLALLLLTGCGLVDPLPDPDAILPLRELEPAGLVQTLHAHTPPDSAGSPVTEMRFTLSPEARAPVEAGSVLETFMRVPAGRVVLEGWDHDAGMWVGLADRQVSGTGSVDWWWRGGWLLPAAGAPLLAPDGTVRFRVSPSAEAGRVALRALEPAEGVGRIEGRGALAASGTDLAILEGTLLRVVTSSGAEVETLTTAVPPASFCRLGGYYFGVTAFEIRRVPVSGGSWSRVSLLPWSSHGGVAISSDGDDLFIVRYPAASEEGTFPRLHRLTPSFQTGGSFNFDDALVDSQELRRGGLTGGTGSAMLWHPDLRVFSVPGVQEGEVGLVTFSKAARAIAFIPLPFEEEELRAAVSGGSLYVSGRPALDGLAWSGDFRPSSPSPGIIFRWTAP
ncbi:MAG: hypothetical protein R6W82_12060 [bacterium]